MDHTMGPEEEVVEAVLTCEGDFHDPELSRRIERFRHRLKDLLNTEKHKLHVKKVEPWNSVKVTFTIPREAAIRLRELAQSGNDVLKQMGVRSVQIQGDNQISLIIDGHNNESTQLVLQSSAPQPSSPPITMGIMDIKSGTPSPVEFGPTTERSNEDLTRKNIVGYLRHGSALKQNATVFNTMTGSGTSPVSALGMGFGTAQSSNTLSSQPAQSSNLCKPNIATTLMQNQLGIGSEINSSIPFTKIVRAFNAPATQLLSSSSTSFTSSTHLTQPERNNLGTVVNSHNDVKSQVILSDTISGSQRIPDSFNSSCPMSSLNHSSSSPNLNFHGKHLNFQTSTSSFMVDLPPPPPYPHKTSTLPQPNIPVTSSSPILINLLQTDPLAAAALLASENSNKSLIVAGKRSSSSPVRKKRRSKKYKDDLDQSLLHYGTSGRNIYSNSNLVSSGAKDAFSNRDGIMYENKKDLFSVNLVQSRIGASNFNHSQDSISSEFHSDRISLFSTDFHNNERDSSNSQFSSNSFRKSGIGGECNSSKFSDSVEQKAFSNDLDTFSIETAAEKIINPYTGHLEPRDSVEESEKLMAVEHNNIHENDCLTKQLEEINKYGMCNSSSLMLDANAAKMAGPNPLSVSTSTAAFKYSGEPSQSLSGRAKSLYNTNWTSSNVLFRQRNESTLSSNFYAVNDKPWKKLPCVTTEISSSFNTETSLPQRLSSADTNIQRSLAFAPLPSNGPVTRIQLLKLGSNPLQHHNAATSIHISRAAYEPSETLVHSSMESSSLPMFHQSLATQSQQTVANHPSTPQSLQNSFSSFSSVPSSISHASNLILPSTPSHLLTIQESERLKTLNFNSTSSDIQNKAAYSNKIVEFNITPRLNFPDSLNSPPDGHLAFQNSTLSPPDKVLSEGDENSNLSGLMADILPEQSGTTTLLEHSGVKTENSDSGVGSSSERSDDTPSEPGDEQHSHEWSIATAQH